jgi:hypothetical protein
MLFVGGPMHGQEVPEGNRIFIYAHEIARVLVLDMGADGHLLQATHNYLKIPYWRFQKPMLHFFGHIGTDPEELIEKARRLLR